MNLYTYIRIGALTDKPYAFKSRAWELTSDLFLDIFDITIPYLILQRQNNEIIRSTSKKSSLFRTAWITDKIRFTLPHVFRNRITNAVFLTIKN